MDGRLEAADERLVSAALAWQKTKYWRGKLDTTLTPEEKELDEAATNWRRVWDELLKEKGSIPR